MTNFLLDTDIAKPVAQQLTVPQYSQIRILVKATKNGASISPSDISIAGYSGTVVGDRKKFDFTMTESKNLTVATPYGSAPLTIVAKRQDVFYTDDAGSGECSCIMNVADGELRWSSNPIMIETGEFYGPMKWVSRIGDNEIGFTDDDGNPYVKSHNGIKLTFDDQGNIVYDANGTIYTLGFVEVLGADGNKYMVFGQYVAPEE